MKYWGLLIIVCLLSQHMNITSASRVREHFYTAWLKYRKHIYLCRLQSLTAVAFIIVIGMESLYNDSKPGVVASTLIELLTTREYTTLIVLTFFISLLKMILEEQVERNVRRRTPNLKNVWLNDLWLLWFFASVLFSVLLGGTEILSKDTYIQNNKYVLATIMIIFLTLTYNFWIYNVLHRQLTEGDGFMSGAIANILLPPPQIPLPPPEDALPPPEKPRPTGSTPPWDNPLRGFIGFMFRSIQYSPPAQVMIVGPRGAGKTHWATRLDGSYNAKVEAQSSETSGLVNTKVVEIATVKLPIPVGPHRIDREFSVQLVDFPGENVGDHCTLPIDLRCDALVLMLPESAFNPELDKEKETDAGVAFEDLDRFFDKRRENNKARDYFHAFFFGLNVDEFSTGVAGRQRIAVGSFALIVNGSDEKGLRYKNHFKENIEVLAKAMALKVGVAESGRRFSYYCNVGRIGGSVLRDTIGSLHGASPSPEGR